LALYLACGGVFSDVLIRRISIFRPYTRYGYGTVRYGTVPKPYNTVLVTVLVTVPKPYNTVKMKIRYSSGTVRETGRPYKLA